MVSKGLSFQGYTSDGGQTFKDSTAKRSFASEHLLIHVFFYSQGVRFRLVATVGLRGIPGNCKLLVKNFAASPQEIRNTYNAVHSLWPCSDESQKPLTLRNG